MNRSNYGDRLSPQYTVIAVFICTSNTKICSPLLKKNNSINKTGSLIRAMQMRTERLLEATLNLINKDLQYPETRQFTINQGIKNNGLLCRKLATLHCVLYVVSLSKCPTLLFCSLIHKEQVLCTNPSLSDRL